VTLSRPPRRFARQPGGYLEAADLGAVLAQPDATCATGRRDEPRERFNVFSGDNGQGKTNLLEVIFAVAALRSFRTADRTVRLGRDHRYAIALASSPCRQVDRDSR